MARKARIIVWATVWGALSIWGLTSGLDLPFISAALFAAPLMLVFAAAQWRRRGE